MQSTTSSTSTRRRFLRTSSGLAAAAAVPTTLALGGEADAATVPVAAKAVANPKGTPPVEPVMAYVHDVKKGTVVIMSGLTERTVQDKELVRRLLTVPKKPKKAKRARRQRKPAGKRTEG